MHRQGKLRRGNALELRRAHGSHRRSNLECGISGQSCSVSKRPHQSLPRGRSRHCIPVAALFVERAGPAVDAPRLEQLDSDPEPPGWVSRGYWQRRSNVERRGYESPALGVQEHPGAIAPPRMIAAQSPNLLRDTRHRSSATVGPVSDGRAGWRSSSLSATSESVVRRRTAIRGDSGGGFFVCASMFMSRYRERAFGVERRRLFHERDLRTFGPGCCRDCTEGPD